LLQVLEDLVSGTMLRMPWATFMALRSTTAPLIGSLPWINVMRW
jgi:hypothetical protein